jgi:hypothetical protein
MFAAAGLQVDAMVGAVLREEAMAPVQCWVVTASRGGWISGSQAGSIAVSVVP